MDTETILFFENDLEIPANELLFDFEQSFKKWGFSLNKKRLTEVLNKAKQDFLQNEMLTFEEQRRNLFKNYDDFEEEFLVWHFAQRKSDALVQKIYQKFLKKECDNDRFLQILALYRNDRQALKTIKSFQLLQRRGCKQYAIIPEKISNNALFEEFATFANIQQVLDSLYLETSAKTADLFAKKESDTKKRNFLQLCYQGIEKTNNFVFLFFREPKERVFVTNPQADVGDHRYKPTNIILKFAKTFDYVDVYSESMFGVKLAKKIAAAFLGTPVECTLTKCLVPAEVLKKFVITLFQQRPNDEIPYAFEAKFQPIKDVFLKISNQSLDLSLNDLITKYLLSLEKLEILEEIEIVFNAHKITLIFKKELDKFSVFFTSRSLSFESRKKILEWGEQFGIALQQK
jgi:hypothetical protein